MWFICFIVVGVIMNTSTFRPHLIESNNRKKLKLKDLQKQYPSANIFEVINNGKIGYICEICKEPKYKSKMSLDNSKRFLCRSCSVCSRTSREFQQVVKDGQAIHDSKYTYTDDGRLFYKSVDSITITCAVHGDFPQVLRDHLQGNGCPSCGHEYVLSRVRRTIEDIVQQASEVHKGAYSYDLITHYTSVDELQPLYCPLSGHGLFYQSIHSHLAGQGCPSCGKLINYSHKDRRYSPMFNSKHSHSNLYIIHFYNKLESFYKIGITVQPETRFRSFKQTGYNVKVCLLIRGLVNEIPVLEKMLQNYYEHVHYKPLQPFVGSKTECFSNIDGILDHIPFDQVEVITNLLSQQEIAA